MLDKSLPYYKVIMLKDDISVYPKYTLPQGYEFCTYRPGYEKMWAEIEVSVGEFPNIQDGLDYFEEKFTPYPKDLKRRCLLVKDGGDRFVGTTTAWYGNDFGDVLPRIHWVAVRPEYQGMGIAKALLTKTFDIFNQLGCKDVVYLTTQTWSYAAINLYLDFGFEPYMGARPANWAEENADFKAQSEEAWLIIFDRLSINRDLLYTMSCNSL